MKRQPVDRVSLAGIAAEDIAVSSGMIEAGLAVLEETNDQPLSRLTVERAFQQMCLRGLQESDPSSCAPTVLRDLTLKIGRFS